MLSNEYLEAGTILWSDLRGIIAQGNNNGDAVVWDGDSFISNAISTITGAGKKGLSHASLLGYLPEPFDSVAVGESNLNDRQLVFRSVTDKLFKAHGTAYWIPTTMTQDQRILLWRSLANREINKVKYDTWGLFEYAAFALFPQWFKGPKLQEDTAFCSAICQYEWAKVHYISPQEYAWCPEDIPVKLMIKPIKVILDTCNIDWR